MADAGSATGSAGRQSQCDAAQPTSTDQLQNFDAVKARFMKLCKELHISFLDQKLYDKYILAERTSSNLYKLCLLTTELLEHKSRTVTVLQLIQRREVVIICIFALTNEFTRGQIGTAELQNKATRLLHSLQKISLKTIEAISHWREQLTRPFPFMFQRLNYILKILADNHVVSSSPLNQVLPMSLYDFPLCSHLPTPELFHQQLQASQGLAAYPLQVSKPIPKASKSNRYVTRLRRAEAYMKQELSQQQTLVKEMQALSSTGMFIPVLNSSVIPGCMTGISLRSSVWGQRLEKALQQAMTALSVPATELPVVNDHINYSNISGYSQEMMLGDEEEEEEEEYEEEEEEHADEKADEVSLQ